MPKEKQITISCQDRPGTLAEVAKLLGRAKVNIVAMNCANFGVHGALQILVDNIAKARKTLDAAHYPYTEQAVLYVELPNSPACLGNLAEKLATADINITAGYATALKGSKKASVVLSVTDLEKADRILEPKLASARRHRAEPIPTVFAVTPPMVSVEEPPTELE